MQISFHPFADDGDIPNNRLPLILYAGAIDPAAGDPAVAFEELFRANGWGDGWRNGIFPFHHYHSTAHEVLGIAAGEAEVRFGGEGGATVQVKAGDAVLIPAGVGHKRLSARPTFWSSAPIRAASAPTSCARAPRTRPPSARASPRCRCRRPTRCRAATAARRGVAEGLMPLFAA